MPDTARPRTPTAEPGSKAELRATLLARRRALDPAEVSAQGAVLAQRVLALLDGPPAPLTVCAYVSTAGEPCTAVLLDRLVGAGHRVLLPVLLDDLDLDWALLVPDEPLVAGRLGLRQPAGPPLGVAAVSDADLVVCPGLAGSPSGDRLGRGGGSYDRALARTEARRALLLHDHELLDTVLAEPHDQPVDVLVTPSHTVTCRSGRSR